MCRAKAAPNPHYHNPLFFFTVLLSGLSCKFFCGVLTLCDGTLMFYNRHDFWGKTRYINILHTSLLF